MPLGYIRSVTSHRERIGRERAQVSSYHTGTIISLYFRVEEAIELTLTPKRGLYLFPALRSRQLLIMVSAGSTQL